MEKDILIYMCVQKEETFFFPLLGKRSKWKKYNCPPPPFFSKQILTTSSFFYFFYRFWRNDIYGAAVITNTAHVYNSPFATTRASLPGAASVLLAMRPTKGAHGNSVL